MTSTYFELDYDALQALKKRGAKSFSDQIIALSDTIKKWPVKDNKGRNVTDPAQWPSRIRLMDLPKEAQGLLNAKQIDIVELRDLIGQAKAQNPETPTIYGTPLAQIEAVLKDHRVGKRLALLREAEQVDEKVGRILKQLKTFHACLDPKDENTRAFLTQQELDDLTATVRNPEDTEKLLTTAQNVFSKEVQTERFRELLFENAATSAADGDNLRPVFDRTYRRRLKTTLRSNPIGKQILSYIKENDVDLSIFESEGNEKTQDLGWIDPELADHIYVIREPSLWDTAKTIVHETTHLMDVTEYHLLEPIENASPEYTAVYNLAQSCLTEALAYGMEACFDAAKAIPDQPVTCKAYIESVLRFLDKPNTASGYQANLLTPALHQVVREGRLKEELGQTKFLDADLLWNRLTFAGRGPFAGTETGTFTKESVREQAIDKIAALTNLSDQSPLAAPPTSPSVSRSTSWTQRLKINPLNKN